MINPQDTSAQRANRPANAQKVAQATVPNEGASAAFRALLERLEKTAKELDVASEAIDNPRQLGEVVETARASVEEALLAGSDLLEAYRAAQAQTSPDDSSTKTESTHPSSKTKARTGHGEAQ